MEFQILLVEDTPELAQEIINVLKSFGYKAIAWVKSGEDAIDIAKRYNFDLVIMDIILSGKLDGIETSSYLKDSAIIFLTSLSDDDVIDKISQSDGSIYLTKPFKVPELKANISIVYKRFQERLNLIDSNNSLKSDKDILSDKLNILGYNKGSIITVENYSYDLEAKRLFFNSKEVELTKKESQFIYLLFVNNLNIVTFDMLRESIWQDDFVPDSTIRSLVRRVRKKLSYDFIKNIVNSGYKLNI
jgi:DNA-binding response OmpR family regulator